MLFAADPLLMGHLLLVGLGMLNQRIVLVVDHTILIRVKVFLICKTHMLLLIKIGRLIQPIQKAFIA